MFQSFAHMFLLSSLCLFFEYQFTVYTVESQVFRNTCLSILFYMPNIIPFKILINLHFVISSLKGLHPINNFRLTFCNTMDVCSSFLSFYILVSTFSKATHYYAISTKMYVDLMSVLRSLKFKRVCFGMLSLQFDCVDRFKSNLM